MRTGFICVAMFGTLRDGQPTKSAKKEIRFNASFGIAGRYSGAGVSEKNRLGRCASIHNSVTL